MSTTANGTPGGSVSSAVGPESIPADIIDVSAMADASYADFFAIDTSGGEESAETWARLLLEQSSTGRSAPSLWRLLGLRLGPAGSAEHVQGWRIADRGDSWIRLETSSWFMTAHAVVRVGRNQVGIALFVRYDHPVASGIWPPVSVLHRRAVPVMLRQAVGLHGCDSAS
jgi:hypothetical protein